MYDSISDSELEMQKLMAPLNEANGENMDDLSDEDCRPHCLRNSNNSNSNSNNNNNGNGNNSTTNKDSRKSNDAMPQSFFKNDVDETNIQEQVYSTLNQIEDVLDAHTYQEILPLSMRIGLEDHVFGWTDLCSIFLGHLFYTLSAYFATFWFLSYFGIKRMHAVHGADADADADNTDNTDDTDDTHHGSSHTFEGCAWQCFVDKIFYNGRSDQYIPIIKVPPMAFIFLRIIFSLFSALSAYRTVRRRTMVWMPSPTSKQRRMSVIETDRTTLLGRIRSGLAKKKHVWLSNRKERKIKKASSRFERRNQRRKRRRRKFSEGSALFEGEHHDRVLQLGRTSERPTPRIANVGSQNRIRDDSSANGDGDSYSSSSRSRHKHLRRRHISRTKSMGSVGDPGQFLETFQRYGQREHINPTHFSGHTMPASAMQSVLQDQIRFKHGFVQNTAYAHGGYFGAAPFMLANPHWINILRCLMPDVYVEISRRVIHAPIPKLIHWAENNPVMAAYGTAHDLEYRGVVPTLEWDIFLDPHLVQRIEIVLDARNKILDSLQNKKSVAGNKRFSERVDAVEKLLTPQERRILGFFNTKVKERVNALVENMLIAHGNGTQLVLEQTGYLKQYNFSRVRHMRRTLGGGIFAKKWVTIYVEALRMSTDLGGRLGSDDEGSPSETSSPSRNGANSSHTEARDDPMSECVSLLHSTEVSDLDDAPLKVNNLKKKNDGLENSTEATRVCRTQQSGVSSLMGDNTSDEKEPTQKSATNGFINTSSSKSGSSSSIAESITKLKGIMNCEAPLGLILDIKSRHVPKRIWALIVDALREAGARVEGVGSFCTQEIRDISQLCSAPVKDIGFFHTAGDLQKACHDGSIKHGDSVFFNGGSLFWNLPDLRDIRYLANMVTTAMCSSFDVRKTKRDYKFESYARVARRHVSDGELVGIPESGSSTEQSDESRGSASNVDKEFLIPRKRPNEKVLQFREGYGSTIEQYKDHFELSIGLYVQEFAIDERSIDLLVKFVNENPRVFNLGLGWGGINGVTVRGIQPGRFTHTDGLWNQRYTGHRWDTDTFPPGNDN